jgi:hypothetical protein
MALFFDPERRLEFPRDGLSGDLKLWPSLLFENEDEIFA